MNRTWTPYILLLSLAVPAVAQWISIEPDSVPAGTNISQAFAGVALNTVNSDQGAADVFAVVPRVPAWASSGALVFGHVAPYAEHWAGDTDPGFRHGSLRVLFVTPATGVRVDFVGNDVSDYGLLQVYSPERQLLQSLETDLLGEGSIQTLSASDVGEIGYIIAGGMAHDTVCLDNIWYIPEPGGAGLLLIVLAAECRSAVGRRLRVHRLRVRRVA